MFQLLLIVKVLNKVAKDDPLQILLLTCPKSDEILLGRVGGVGGNGWKLPRRENGRTSERAGHSRKEEVITVYAGST